MPPGFKHPGEYGLTFENIWITTKDKIKLHAWFVKVTGNYAD